MIYHASREFLSVLAEMGVSSAVGLDLWSEVEQRYRESHRRYHTIEHLDSMLTLLKDVKHDIADFRSLVLALIYHDIIYKTLSSDNEERSAELARKRLASYVDPAIIEKVCDAILSTKRHEEHADQDVNYFLDADLSILGSSEQRYSEYSRQIRKEYSVVPDLLYRPGRKKVLKHFLAMEKIFKTSYFRLKFEDAARRNLKQEQNLL
jgi:predicted metal-dependent HD superfamily phosphohydrolase